MDEQFEENLVSRGLSKMLPPKRSREEYDQRMQEMLD